MGTGEVQLCTQLQRAGSAWATGELVKSFDELKKAPFDAAVSVPVRTCIVSRVNEFDKVSAVAKVLCRASITARASRICYQHSRGTGHRLQRLVLHRNFTPLL